MKRFLLFLTCISCAAAGFSQTLFTYGNNSVDKEEFLKAYNKNKTVVTDKEASLREYLDLYTKFKLKVKAAQELRLDTLPQLRTDLDNFRTQVEESYMNNEKAVDALIDEAFYRSQKDLHVYHFFAAINGNGPDSVKAYQALAEIANSLKQGNTNYDALANDASVKYVKVKAGDLGFITVFSVPYEYENIIYNLKPGEVSVPYRTKNGIHLFKLVEERKTAGRWRVAQLLFSFPPGGEKNPAPTKQKADSVYKLLKAGADFAKLANQVSDDKMTYVTGGEMPEFGTGKFQPVFEKEVFVLSKDGDYTAPFETPFGFHIVKRIKQTPTSSDKNDDGYRYELKQKILQDNRMTGAKEKFAKEIISKIGYKKNTVIKDADLFRYADSVAVYAADADVTKYPISTKTIFSFGKTNVTGAEWLNFIKDFKGNLEIYKGESNQELLDKFISVAAMDYYRKHLEEYNDEFRYQMKEFKEGNMLFEVMERNVWGSASQDTAALKKLYEQNKTKYRWAASATVILFNCTNAAAAEQARAALIAGKDWKKIAEESNNTIIADSGRYELPQIPAAEGTKFKTGIVTPVLPNTVDGSASFVKVLETHADNEQRSFEDARGLVINDYQNVMEDKWIEDLKKKYPVKVNEDVFKSLLK
jgi:peptidyl-prolyl cis-trans isomerase SurA